MAAGPANDRERIPMTFTAPEETRVGHVHLRVSDLERAVAFYRDVLGFSVQVRAEGAAWLGAGGYHHHVALNTWKTAGATKAPPGHTGLYHAAFLYPTLDDLKTVARRVRDAGVRIYGHSDHGVSIALYFDDPDGNGVEIYWDRPKDEWPRAETGEIVMPTHRFELDAFLAE
jgi:catechol 2,3-dioxygenase